MEYPPQLTPVQAWLLGYIDGNMLRDHLQVLEDDSLFAAFARAVCDEDYRDSIIVEAQDLLEGEASFRDGNLVGVAS